MPPGDGQHEERGWDGNGRGPEGCGGEGKAHEQRADHEAEVPKDGLEGWHVALGDEHHGDVRENQ